MMNGAFKVHRVNFSNFCTFRDDAEISFVLGTDNVEVCGGLASWAVDDVYLSPVITVAGSNRGLFNSIRPLISVARFVSGMPIPLPGDEVEFHTHPLSENENGEVVVVFELGGKLYRHVLMFESDKIVFEALYVKTSKLFSCVFARDVVSGDVKVSKFGVTATQLKSTRQNCSIVAAAAELGSPLAQALVSAFSPVAASDGFARPADVLPADILTASRIFAENEALRQQLVSFLSTQNEFLVDVVFEKKQYDFDKIGERELFIPFGVKRIASACQESCIQPLWNESRDLLAVFVQLSRVLPILQKGGVAVMDRLDEGVPDETLPFVIDLFLKKDTNPHGAQLLFTANCLDVLKCMHASQIYMIR